MGECRCAIAFRAKTVGEIRKFLADLPDATPAFDGYSEPVLVTIHVDENSRFQFIEIGDDE